jgi:hypothetical protein
MSNTLSGQNLGVFPYNLDGLQNIDVSSINGQQFDFSNIVQYSGNTENLDMGPYNIKTAHTAAAANDVVNLLSLTSRLSSLTGYILGINGLNYVPYSGATTNTDLGTYGLSAGNITANSSLTVGGLSILNGNITAISNLNVNGLTTLNRGQTNFTAVSSLDITNKAYVDSTITSAIANISVGSSILATNNIFTGTNEFNNNITAGFGFTTDLNGVIQTKLNSLGFTSASFTTSGITGTYTPPLGTITNVSGSTYQIAQTNQGRAIMAISGFAPSVLTTYIFQLNIKCTVGTAIFSVEQDNILRSPQYYQLSTSFNTITGTFYYDGNPSTIIFKIYAGVASWNAQWDLFTLSTYSAAINYNMAATGPTRFLQTYNATGADTTTLVNRQTMDAAISSGSIVNNNNTFTGTNLFNSTLSTSPFSDVSLGGITTITAVPFTTGQLQAAGISSQANSPGTLTFGVPATLTPSPTTAPFASCYSISQLFPTTNARYECRFTGFTSPIFGVSLTIYRANVANTARIAISATVPVVVGTFTLGFLPNSNPSFVGQVFLEFSGTANKTMGWTSFTYRQGIETIAGNFTVSGDTTTASITINNGVAGTLTKLGSTTGYYASLAGGNATNSPFLEFYAGGSRRFFMGDATTTEMKFQSENGAQLNFYTGGTSRMTIANGGTITLNGNVFTGSSAGRIYWTNPNGSNTHWGYPSGGGSDNYIRGTQTYVDTPISFSSGVYDFNSLPWQNTTYARIPTLTGNGITMQQGQALTREIYRSNAVGWTGGINMTYAFYKSTAYTAVRISGMASGYTGGATHVYPTFRLYSQNSGAYTYYETRSFTNFGGNHVCYPIDYVVSFANIPTAGWYDLYFYSGGGLFSDGNDRLQINITMLPGADF